MAQWVSLPASIPQGTSIACGAGLRSQTVQAWLREAGIEYPLVKGGYKAMRRFLLEELERSVAQADFVLISGKTGTGKTRVIARLARAVDLEGLANHRGSSFGQLPTPQPSQIDFENGLSIVLMKLLARQQRTHFSGRRRAACWSPLPARSLCARKWPAPMLVVEQSLDERIDVVIEDYVVDLGRRYAEFHGEPGALCIRKNCRQDLLRIGKRLGGERHQQVSDMMDEAFAQQWRNATWSGTGTGSRFCWRNTTTRCTSTSCPGATGEQSVSW